jgi:hypothetical protein
VAAQRRRAPASGPRNGDARQPRAPTAEGRRRLEWKQKGVTGGGGIGDEEAGGDYGLFVCVCRSRGMYWAGLRWAAACSRVLMFRWVAVVFKWAALFVSCSYWHCVSRSWPRHGPSIMSCRH